MSYANYGGASPVMPGAQPPYPSSSPQPGHIQPGSITYTTSVGPDGQVTYHPFRAVPASYQTPQGIVSGIQWIPAEATQVLPNGATPATADFMTSFNRDERRRRDKEYERDRREREKAEDKEAHRRDKELRKARDRDRQATADIERRMQELELDRREREIEERDRRTGTGTRSRRGSMYGDRAAGYAPAPGGPGYAAGPGSAYGSPQSGYGTAPAGYPPSTYPSGYAPPSPRPGDAVIPPYGAGGVAQRPVSPYHGTAPVQRSVSPYYGGGPTQRPVSPYHGAGPVRPVSPYQNPVGPIAPRPVSPYRRAGSPLPPVPGSYEPPRSHSPLPPGAPVPYGAQSTPYGAAPYGAPGVPVPYGGAQGTAPYGGAQGGAYGGAQGGAPYGGAQGYPPTMSPIAPGEEQKLVPPEGFSRPPNLAQPYTHFEIMKIQDMDDFLQVIPRMPLVLVPHDVYHEDWIRFVNDLSMSWSGRMPLSEADYGVDGRPPKRTTVTADLIDLWNASFFAARGVEVVLYKGRERRSGRSIGTVDLHLPGLDTYDPESESSDSSSSDDSDDGADELRRYGGYGGGAYGSRQVERQMAELREARRLRREKKLDKKLRKEEKKRRAKAKQLDKKYALYLTCTSPREGGLGQQLQY
ncbi:hypothetical protein CERSUDRAFT_102851 [Gelatoporia subvermispora B]|uniref:Uncharacterized protein n=1 Tax=Ceriporiopsis subvermispora (strain B) TaxID=914234 RepID=M2QTT2_CERS8|nr:hypothetical protein CERSUDRAFT_102851 [Gelatoporia subvermispora B]